MTREVYPCPVCIEGQVEVAISGPRHYPEPHVVTVCCELDPSQRDALEQRAIEDAVTGARA